MSHRGTTSSSPKWVPRDFLSKSDLPVLLDYLKSGQYAIVNCGENANSVATMLETLWGALVQATQDAESATMSSAYQTFFKDPENMAFVSNILAQSSAGAAIHPPNQVTNGAPAFFCVTAAGQLAGSLADGRVFDAYTHCRENPTMSAASLSGTPYMALCPYFWDSGLGTIKALPPQNNCLSVNAKNKFNRDRLGRAGPKLTQWAMWVLLEEIVHVFLMPEQLKRGITTPLEFYDANQVLGLSADDSLMNAASYVLYVASMSWSLLVAPWLSWRQGVLMATLRYLRPLHRFSQRPWVTTAWAHTSSGVFNWCSATGTDFYGRSSSCC